MKSIYVILLLSAVILAVSSYRPASDLSFLENLADYLKKREYHVVSCVLLFINLKNEFKPSNYINNFFFVFDYYRDTKLVITVQFSKNRIVDNS